MLRKVNLTKDWLKILSSYKENLLKFLIKFNEMNYAHSPDSFNPLVARRSPIDE